MFTTWNRVIRAGAIGAMSFAAAFSFAQYNPRALVEPTGAVAAPQVEAFAAQWPLELDGPAGKVTIFQPQMEELSGDMLSARSAVSIAKQGGEPVFGVVWFKSRVSIDRTSRAVRPVDVTITQTRIPEAGPDAEQSVREAISRGMMSSKAELPFDQLVEMLETRPQSDGALKFDAPRILFLDRPAIKVQYDGEPKLMKAKDSTLERVANTPFFVARDPGSNTFYLKGGGVWYDAPDAKGPFRRSSRVPSEVIALADQSGYKDPQEPLPAEQLERLEIVTATEPTELIWTDGVPQMGAVPGTGLLYVTNTESNVFVDVQSQRTYVLLSGRWYEAANRSGPWAFVPPGNLPADFSKIPAQSERGEVLAHIAGTPQAKQAVADAQIPQTAAVDRKNFQQPKIQYDGDPFFEPVEGTSLSYAANTAQSVVRVDNMYYACYDAVWYQSTSPNGPWDLCTSVPNEVYNIPASSPVYPVKYVYVYGSSPDYVYTGYTPGYLGTYAYDGAVVYGTGYYYRPWYGNYYYPRAYTYGFGARYDYYGSSWGFSFGYGWGGGSLWLGYNSGSYGYCDPWFGYSGYYPYYGYGYRNYPYRHGYHGHYAHHDHDDRHDYHGSSNGNRARNDRDDDRDQRANAFGNQRNANASREQARSANVYDRRSDVQRVADSSSRTRDTGGRSAGQPPRSDPDSRSSARNNVLADRDGRVFRQTDDGNWQSRSDGQWRTEGRTPTALANEPVARQANRQAARTTEARAADVRSSNPGTPRVRTEDRTPSVSSEPRAGRSTPANSQPEVIRPRTSTQQRQAQPQVQDRATPQTTPRSNRYIRVSPSNPQSTRNQVADSVGRRTGGAPPLAAPDVRRDDSAGSSDRSSGGSGVRPGRVEVREPAPRESSRVTAREPARVAPAPTRSAPAPRESVRSAPPVESRPRMESRPQISSRSEPAPRMSAPSRSESRSAPAPRSSGGGGGGGGRFDSSRSTGGGGSGRNR